LIVFKHILLPLDGSELAESALPVAACIAEKMHAQITLLHVIEKNAPASVHGQPHLTNEKDACTYLSHVAAEHLPPSIRVERHVHSEEIDKVSASIVDHSGEFAPDLIILCSHGQGGLHDFFVGNIAQQVIAAGAVPVLLLKPDSSIVQQFSGFDPILVALDGDPQHESGLAISTELAQAFKASVHLIQVVPTLSTLKPQHKAASTLLPSATRVLLDIDEDAACEYLEEKINSLSAAGVNVSAEVERGDPTRQVVQSAIAKDSRLIILGTHGKAGMNAFWAGSVAPRIVEQTEVPVLLVPVRR
jgi:nucleotide-binding universal stress UspA family protein